MQDRARPCKGGVSLMSCQLAVERAGGHGLLVGTSTRVKRTRSGGEGCALSPKDFSLLDKDAIKSSS